MENMVNEALGDVGKDQSSVIKAVHMTSEIQTKLNDEENVSSIIAFIENSVGTYAMEQDVDENCVIKKCDSHQKEERVVSNKIASPKSNDQPMQKNNDKRSVLITEKMESIARKKGYDISKYTIQEKRVYDKQKKNSLSERGKEKVSKECRVFKKNSKEDVKTNKHKHVSKGMSTKSTCGFYQKKPNELKYFDENNSKSNHNNVICMQSMCNEHSESKVVSLSINKTNDKVPSKLCSKVDSTGSLSTKREHISQCTKSNNLSNRNVKGDSPDSEKNRKKISTNKHKCVRRKEESEHVAKKSKTKDQSNSSQQRSKNHWSSSLKNKSVQNEKKSISCTCKEKSNLNVDKRLKMKTQVLIPQLTSYKVPELSEHSKCDLILELEDDNNIISSNNLERAKSTAERELSSKNVSHKRKDKTNENDIEIQSSVPRTTESCLKTDMLLKKSKPEISTNSIKKINSVVQSSVKQNRNSNKGSQNSNDKIAINDVAEGNILQCSNVPINGTLMNNERNDLILNQNQHFQPVQECTIVQPTIRHVAVPTVPVYKNKTTHCQSKNENSKADNKNKLNITVPKVEQKKTDNKQCEQSSTESDNLNALSTDSDETLSNVESVPNSPSQQSQNGTSKENNITESNSSENEDASKVTNTNCRDISKNCTPFKKKIDTARKNSQSSNDEIDGDLGSDTNRNNIPQYYVEVEKPPDNILEHAESIAAKSTDVITKYDESELVKNSMDEPLRDYKEPRRIDEAVHTGRSTVAKNSHKKCTTKKKILSRNKIPILRGSRNEKYLLRNRDKKHLNIRKHISLKVSRKKSLRDVHSNSEYSSSTWRTKKDAELLKNKNHSEDKEMRSTAKRTIENGHALTLEEVDILYAKFLRDGHFRTDPNLPPFISSKGDKNNYIAISMQCYDPREHGISAVNASRGPNGEIDSNAQLNKNLNYNNGNANAQFSPVERSSNSQSSMEKSLYSLKMDVNFTEPILNTFVDLLTTNESIGRVSDTASNAPWYTKNETVTGCSNIHNKNDLNFFVNSNTMQSNDNKMASNNIRYTSNTDSNYNSSYYQTSKYVGTNKTNFVTDPSCSNLNTDHSNHESFMNVTNDNPLLSNSANQTNNLTAVPNFQNSPVNNEWSTLPSTGSGAFDESSMNNFRTNASTINHANQGMNASSPMSSNDSCNLNGTNNQNPLTCRNNNFSNSGYMVLPPWNDTQYASYLNTTRPYFNGTYNPFNTNYVGFDVPNVSMLNDQNYMGNNTSAWSQNIFPFTNNENSVLHGSAFNNFEAFDVNSFPLQENTIPSVQSTQLPSVKTILSQVNTFSESLNNVSSDYRMNGETIQSNSIDDNSAHSRANLYNNNCSNEETCVQHVPRYKYDVQNTEFHNTELVKHTGDGNNYQQIHGSLNQKMKFESEHSCHERPGSPDCVIIAELTTREPILSELTTKESDIHQLRRELADFTKQYTANQPMDSTSKPF